MTSKAKTKGNSWERECCKILEKHLGGSWIRVPNSGAYIGGSHSYRKSFLSDSQNKIMKGDIIPPDEFPKFVAECKNYKSFSFHLLLSNENKQIDGWIKQTTDCVSDNDIWFLFIKVTRTGSYVCFDSKLKSLFLLGNHAVYKNYIVTDMNDFIEQNKDVIKKLCS